MNPRPTRETVEGRAYLDLQNLARRTSRPTDELHQGRLAAAQLHFHVDVNIADPITPTPEQVAVPRRLGGEIHIVGYPIEMVLAEKIVTAIARGSANTRWRDFVDIAALAATRPPGAGRLDQSLRAVARHRLVDLAPLAEVLDGYPDLAQTRWRRWRAKNPSTSTPEGFDQLLATVIALADPVIAGETGGQKWDPVTLASASAVLNRLHRSAIVSRWRMTTISPSASANCWRMSRTSPSRRCSAGSPS